MFGKMIDCFIFHQLAPEALMKFCDLSIFIFDSLYHFKKLLTVFIPFTFVHFPSHESGLRCICAPAEKRESAASLNILSHSGEKVRFVHTNSSSAKHSLFKGNTLTFYWAKTGGWVVEMGGTNG